MNERIFYETILEYVEYDDYEKKEEVLVFLKESQITFDKTSSFTRKSWQWYENIELRVPINFLGKARHHFDYLLKVINDIYVETDEYDFGNLLIKPRAKQISEINFNETGATDIQDSEVVYINLKNKVYESDIDDIEKKYIIESCECALNGNNLAAATMIGCAAERLLLLMSQAFLEYLRNNGDSKDEASNFEKKVVSVDKAHKRLENFHKYVSNREKLFEELGFEKSNLHFSFLDIIRQVRNDSGHPTGNYISSEDLQTIMAQYNLVFEKLHNLIDNLPQKRNNL